MESIVCACDENTASRVMLLMDILTDINKGIHEFTEIDK